MGGWPAGGFGGIGCAIAARTAITRLPGILMEGAFWQEGEAGDI